jgi:thymidylate synthase
MRILAIVQGGFGRRKVTNLRVYAPGDWEVEVCALPPSLPLVLDDPGEYLPDKLSRADLVLALGESPSAMQLVPEVVRKTGAEAVIVPVDNRDWLPPGLMSQLKEELESMGVCVAFPAPFCALKGGKDERIRAFSKYFGKPELKIEVGNGVIRDVEVVRDAPCGNTRYVADKLIGVRVDKASMLAQQYHHQFPCLASSIKDKYAHDNMMNRAGRILEKEIKKHLPSAG